MHIAIIPFFAVLFGLAIWFLAPKDNAKVAQLGMILFFWGIGIMLYVLRTPTWNLS